MFKLYYFPYDGKIEFLVVITPVSLPAAISPCSPRPVAHWS